MRSWKMPVEEKLFACVYVCVHHQFWDKAAGVAVTMNDFEYSFMCSAYGFWTQIWTVHEMYLLLFIFLKGKV